VQIVGYINTNSLWELTVDNTKAVGLFETSNKTKTQPIN
jgi:hypothetical protein